MPQIQMYIDQKDKDLIILGSRILGEGYTTFMKAASLERARDLIVKNKILLDEKENNKDKN